MEKKQGTTVKEFFIFNRDGICLYHIDLQDDEIVNKAVNIVTEKKLEHRYKLIYGLLFTMKAFVKKFSVNKDKEIFKSFNTSEYKLHYVDFINGIRFVILSSPTKSEYSGFLKNIFKLFYSQIISTNLFTDKDAYISNKLFDSMVTDYIRTKIII